MEYFNATTGFVPILNLLPNIFNTRNSGDHLQLTDDSVLPFTRTDLYPTVGVSFRYEEQPDSNRDEIVMILAPDQIGLL